MKNRKFFLTPLFIFIAGALHAGLLLAAGGSAQVTVITINGAINPVSADYIVRSIKRVNESPNFEALVIELDTPGGLDTSMRQIVKAIQASATPVVVYVAPSGSRAASAGAFITMASHIAAMAPGSSIGAATPVNIGGEGMDKTMKKKVTNDAAAYLRSLAEAHGRSGDWGEKFVRKGASLSETEALKENVIDLIAENLGKLLEQIDGKTVKTATGEKTLATRGATVERVAMTWRENFFDAIANPNIAYLLMMLGFYGLIFELSNPGSILPGVIGAISLILAFYSLQALPVNYAGALLILLAIVMFMLEVWVVSYGLLTLGGIGALVIGSMMLIDTPAEYLKISLMVIIPTALLTAGFFVFLISYGIKAQFRDAAIGFEAMVGHHGVSESALLPDSVGKVLVDGDLWDAVTDEDIEKGAAIEVVSSKGLTLKVRKPTANG